MKQMRWFIVLLIGIFISACAAANSTATAPIPTVAALPGTATAPIPTVSVQQGGTTEVLKPAAQATSRGDKLEASAPASLKVGDGQPVLIEFFRFT